MTEKASRYVLRQPPLWFMLAAIPGTVYLASKGWWWFVPIIMVAQWITTVLAACAALYRGQIEGMRYRR